MVKNIQQPKVEIVVSKSVYDEIQASVKNTQVLGWLVGGARFRAPQIKALNDDGSVEHYSNEEIATGKATADEILFEKIESAAKQTRNFEASDLENHFDDSSRYAQLAEFNTENPSSDSQWLFRRRRTHHRTVVHVVEKKVEEGSKKLFFFFGYLIINSQNLILFSHRKLQDYLGFTFRCSSNSWCHF